MHSRTTAALCANASGEDLNSQFECVRSACADIGRLFKKNDYIDFSSILRDLSVENAKIAPVKVTTKMTPIEELEEHILEVAHGRTSTHLYASVKEIAIYIQKILDDPSLALRTEDYTASTQSILAAKLIGACLLKFPFLVVLDEADTLDKPIKVSANDDFSLVKVTQFEVLRRAISYLVPGTKIFFLTLGTRSDIHNLNPPLRENSRRLQGRNELPRPILLLSNTSVFSEEEYPIEKLHLNQEVLKNPMLFKFLATLGHPLWSSIKFDSLIAIASAKIINGSEAKYKYVIPLWMIRAGLAASPKDMNTRTLIASHMATLFDLSPDLTRMLVFYPSDPILAITCRHITSEYLSKPEDNDKLYSMLSELSEAVQVDRGQMAECVGVMNVLRAIDLVKEVANYNCNANVAGSLISQMETEAGYFNGLWRKKNFILEPPSDIFDPNVPATHEFSNYRVVGVEKFLESLLSANEFSKIKSKLPKETLNGLVNASHAVRITRAGGESFTFRTDTFPPMELPRADKRIADENCNLIDDALLKLGLIHQCCFLMPDRYFGYDLILPVMLEDGTYTFIGIQFKAADVAVGVPVEKMQARFHYVRCPLSKDHDDNCPRCGFTTCDVGNEASHTPENCSKCAKEAERREFADRLAKLYGNQITLLISLDSTDSKSFANSVKFSVSPAKGSKKRPKNNRAFNQNALKKLLDPCKKKFTSPSSVSGISFKSKNFMKPLVSVRDPFGKDSNLMLISSLWYDGLVDLKKLSVTKGLNIPFIPDGFVHRQYCIAVRGMEKFKHLYQQNDAVENAQRLIAGDSNFFKNYSTTSDPKQKHLTLKAILYDASVNYVLAEWRGLSSLEAPFGYKKAKEVMRRYFAQCVQENSGASSNLDEAIEWILGSKLPSKQQRYFEMKAQELFSSLPAEKSLLYWDKKAQKEYQDELDRTAQYEERMERERELLEGMEKMNVD